MELTSTLKRAICGLFEVHADEKGVQRVITPLEYPGSGDRIVIRVRPTQAGYKIDDNGEAALYASMAGGDVESDVVARWVEETLAYSPTTFSDDEVISATTPDERLTAPYIFRVAEAAQHLFSVATARGPKKTSDFRERLAAVIEKTATTLGVAFRSDVELPIAGGMKADYILDHQVPLLVIAATNATRLLEAEVIHVQYRLEKKPGFVLAIAESQTSVGKAQFERANYYTGKTVTFSESNLPKLIEHQLH
ncbi:hypothetical protein [Paraburkholderia unamae]|uniref:DUF1828 domain-containing protein n=1 Tax=Paraburkholderia unamae TaxID=219649 RepID=A0ABX5KXI0_9BURK|nr:hypothetical protein [Paraburkholderia unamae]PVX97534.1 hypothetical protein C7402_101245 [Paraburkholderia unamae]